MTALREYENIVDLLEKVFNELPEGVDLAKGGVGEIALAHHLEIGRAHV